LTPPVIDDALGDFRWAVEAIEGPFGDIAIELGAICHACGEIVELLDWGATRVLAEFTMTGGIALVMAALATRPPLPRCTDSARRLAGGSMIRLEGSSPFLFVNVIRTD
jgi:hypothetical protein